jgi:hypothetical protein
MAGSSQRIPLLSMLPTVRGDGIKACAIIVW